ncbi:ubiquinone/menaquinone biosynthesis methyltransferase [Legionella massiliensis]|uniref:Ubiquinone/menaquinone biosynthesis methyltransferase n=1 Tax=Legionella massiliensis TaxID=1034943 RepID=A0A078L2E2_9GAMM|nr:class I SAM-dependent methyltransferase [Legionella massiliensis]CDZ78168.1 ubiquinone/menaquinone biosynthesis methyltransferase [Legionella massiliensis]CEE13906.1 Ubiquinone/menaquinone biosynthesis C-methyltransferase UbiE [Legionella massiliensis]
MDYIKHFNQQANNYLRFRPDYPTALYDYLLTLVAKSQCAWDCGTGNGQAALILAERFEQVIASDVNQAPLDVAPKKANIRYLCCAAEKTPIEDKSVDLITIAQAMHWFNFDLFYQEIRRVAKDSAVIAAWCYSLGKFGSEIDKQISKLYDEILGDDYWPVERRYIDKEYQTIPFPFKRITTPSFSIEKELNLPELLGYLNTWSAVKEYELRNKLNPITLVADELASIWGDPQIKYKISWPLHLLVAPVNS